MDAVPGTIRVILGIETGRNVVHGSDLKPLPPLARSPCTLTQAEPADYKRIDEPGLMSDNWIE